MDLFFVLSGFLITLLLLREKTLTGTIALPKFYARRALRIFPLYYALLLAFAVYFATAGRASGSLFLQELPWHATYLSNWVQTESLMSISWSLSTEEQFYLVWPPLLASLGYRSVPLVVGFLVLNEMLNFGAFDEWLDKRGVPVDTLNILQITFAPILLGTLSALGIAQYKTRSFLLLVLRPAVVWALLLVLLVAANHPNDRGWSRFSFHLCAALIISAIALRPDLRLVRWLETAPLRYIGRVSYGVYLLHIVGLDVARRGLDRFEADSPNARFVLGMAITVSLAALSFRFFEGPMLSLKSRFRTPTARGGAV